MDELRMIRLAKRISQRELAAMSGVSRSAIATAELGRHMPNWSTLEKIAKALGVSVADLVPEMETPSSKDEALVEELAAAVHTGRMSAADALDELRRHNLLRPRKNLTGIV
jgi:transcriptional regulator with XRE-family HTH domain